MSHYSDVNKPPFYSNNLTPLGRPLLPDEVGPAALASFAGGLAMVTD